MNGVTAIGDGDVVTAALPLRSERVGSSAPNFGAMLADGVDRLNQDINVAEKTLNAYALGEVASTHELMLAMEKARFSMQVAVEVRNRLVEAYGELTRMQV